MHADGYRLADERAHERHTFGLLAIFSELVTQLDPEPALDGERFNRLHAAVVRARQDPRERNVRKLVDQRCGLADASSVERALAIIARPLRAVAGAGCRITRPAASASRQANAACAWRLRRFHAPGNSARASARRARSRSISRPAARPEPTPRSRRTARRMCSSATTAS